MWWASTERVLTHFERLYDLKLQIEQRSDKITTLEAALSFNHGGLYKKGRGSMER